MLLAMHREPALRKPVKCKTCKGSGIVMVTGVDPSVTFGTIRCPDCFPNRPIAAPVRCTCLSNTDNHAPICAISRAIAAPETPVAARPAPEAAQPTHDHQTDRPIPNAKPKPNKGRALGNKLQEQEGGISRTVVRFTGFRVRPLDPDNFAGSVKELLDGLRHAHLINGDEAWRIKLETDQVKVAHYKDEKTVIEITTP